MLFITPGKIWQQYKNNSPKIIAPTWKFELDLPDGFYSVSYIWDYIEYIIKKHETLRINIPSNVYIKSIINRLLLKIKDLV